MLTDDRRRHTTTETASAMLKRRNVNGRIRMSDRRRLQFGRRLKKFIFEIEITKTLREICLAPTFYCIFLVSLRNLFCIHFLMGCGVRAGYLA